MLGVTCKNGDGNPSWGSHDVCQKCWMKAINEKRLIEKRLKEAQEGKVMSTNELKEKLYTNQTVERKGSDKYAGTQYATPKADPVNLKPLEAKIETMGYQIDALKEEVEDSNQEINTIQSRLEKIEKDVKEWGQAILNINEAVEAFGEVIREHVEDKNKHAQPVEFEMKKVVEEYEAENKLPDKLEW